MKLSRRKFIKNGLLLLSGSLLFDALWFEKYFIEWNHFDISKNKNEKIKIVQISDLHIRTVGYIHKSIAEKINKSKPDLIFFTGDSVDKAGKINVLNKFLTLIDISIPKFAVMGNWEYWGNIDADILKKTFSEHNCKLLINETVNLTVKNRKIAITGVDDYIGGNPDFPSAIKNSIAAETNIVLSHCPAYRDIITREKGDFNIDVVLSGHTHGGQISFFGITPFKPEGSGRYLKGWYKKTKPAMYVSKGIGTSILPVRFGARAEIVEMEI